MACGGNTWTTAVSESGRERGCPPLATAFLLYRAVRKRVLVDVHFLEVELELEDVVVCTGGSLHDGEDMAAQDGLREDTEACGDVCPRADRGEIERVCKAWLWRVERGFAGARGCFARGHTQFRGWFFPRVELCCDDVR